LLQDIKNTIKQSAIYGLSRVSTKIVAFILLPFITLNLSVSEYGIYVLTESLWQILWSVFLFGLESGLVRWFLSINDEIRKKKFLFSVTVSLLIFNLLLISAIFLYSGSISKIVYENDLYSKFVLYAALIAFAETFAFIIFLILRIEEKVKTYTVLAILSTAISLLLQIYFLQFTVIKLEGIFISKIIAPLAVIIILSPYFFKHLKFGFEKIFFIEIMKYSFPIMCASFVVTLLNQVDRYILGFLTNLNNVGIYGLAYNISGLINFLIISPFSLAFTVLSWKKLKEDNADRFYTKTITYLFLVVTYISVIIALFTPHLIKIFTLKTDYWIASAYVPWIILSMPFYGIHIIGVFSFYVTKKTKYMFYCYIIALLFNIILNFVFIPHFKIFGAAFVNLFSFIILALSVYFFSRQNFFIKYEWNKIFIIVLSYFLVVFPFFYFNLESRVIEIFLKVIAVIVFPFILYLLKFYEPIEIEFIKSFINKYLIKKLT
jgi:O-antigen/teichoic acid export membrane protein